MQYQYEYCSGTAPHQLTGMYPLGTTCSNLSGAVYKTSYDAWGSATSRTYGSNSTTQSFDLLNQLVKWNLGTSQKAWYAYDTGGERTIQRTTNGTTSMTVYAFGSEEYQYDGSGTLQSSTHYDDLGGRLIGELTGNGTPTTSLFLTDELGSVLATFSNTQGSAAVQGNQTYGPYGSQQYQQGSMNTAKGYTGQYADPLTGFDYYNARYYDPVAGVFLSADSVQGNASGANPYAYVGGNPETSTDPTGEMMCSATCGGGGGSGGNGNPTPPPAPAPSCTWWCWAQQQWNNFNNDVVHPVEQYAQQAQETIIHHIPAIAPAILPIVIGVAAGVAAVAAIGSAAYAIWQFTHTDPNWSNVVAGQDVIHPRWVEERRDGKAGLIPSKGHIISRHVNITDSGMQSRARNPNNKEHTATKFYNQDLAQYAVDYALSHMSLAQKMQLLWMRGSPFSRFGATLTLSGNAGVSLGEGYRYNPANGQFTKLTNLSSFKVVIGIDFKTGQPFIITAYPTD